MSGIFDTKEGINALQRNQQFFEKGVGDTTAGSRLLGTIMGTDVSPSEPISAETSYLDPVSRTVYNVVAPYGKLALNIALTAIRLPGAAAADIANMFGVKEKDVNEIQALTNAVIFQSFGQGPRAIGAGSQIKNIVKTEAKWLPEKSFIPLSTNQQKLIQNLVESKPKSALNRTSKVELFNSIFSDPNLIKDPLLINKLAKELNNQGLFLGKDPLKNAQTFLGRIINRAKAGELNPKAVENYKRIATEGMGEGAKTSLKKITKEQRQAGQAESVKIQRLNRVKKYKNLYNTMIDNNLTFDQAVTSAYKAATGKDISKATKHDQIIGAFYRNEKTLKNKNPTLHKFFENEVKAYQIGKATDRQVKYGTKEYELARQELAKTLGIDVKDIDRAHSIMKPRLAKLYNLLQEGKITRQDYERLQRPSFFLLKKQNKDHVRLENSLDSLLERKKFLMDNKNIVDANKTQVAIDKVIKEMELIGVKSELYHPIDKLLTVFGKEPSVKELQSLATKQLKNMGGLVGISHLTRPLRNFSS